MNDTEDRLRNGLQDLADAVPPSSDARADLERRLARRRRRPLLVTAAAVAVVAAVAVPVALSWHGDPTGGQVPTTPPSPTTSTTIDYNTEIIAGPVLLGEYTKNGVHWQMVLTVRPDWPEEYGGEIREMVCVNQISPGNQMSGMGSCSVVPQSWPDGPYVGALDGEKGWVKSDHMSNGGLPNQWLIVAAPQVAAVEVRRKDGSLVPAKLVAESPHGRFYVGEIEGGLGESRGYVAKNAAGNVLEQVVI